MKGIEVTAAPRIVSKQMEAGGTTSDERTDYQALEEKVEQLEQALQSRVVIEQAKGVLIERMGLDADSSFHLLRHSARSTRRPIHELAAEVVATRRTPSAITIGLARLQRHRSAAQIERTEAVRERSEAQLERAQRLAERRQRQEERLGGSGEPEEEQGGPSLSPI